MDTYLNERQKDTLLKVLENPADSGSAYASNLAELANMYPQSGLLRALLSRARNESNPEQAAALFNSRLLHKLYHHAADFAEVTPEQLIINQYKTVAPSVQVAPEQQAEPAAQLPVELPAVWNLSQGATNEAETTVAEEGNAELPREEAPADALPEQPEVAVEPLTAQQPVAEIAQPEITPVNQEPNAQPETAAEPPIAQQSVAEIEQPEIESVNQDLNKGPEAATEPLMEQEPDVELAQPETPPASQELVEEPKAEEERVTEEEPGAGTEQPEVPFVNQEPTPQPASFTSQRFPKPTPVAEQPAQQPEPAAFDEEEEFDVEKYNAELNSLIDILEAENAAREPIKTPEPADFTAFTPPLEASQRPQQPESHIEDEVFEEIASVDSFILTETAQPQHVETVIPELEQPYVGPAEPDAPVDKQHAEDTRSYQSSAIGTDYFTFDRTYREPAPEPAAPQPAASLTPATIAAKVPASQPAAEEQHDVSRYHDEQMPYTFMWWLDKTRKEHAQLYQPFAAAPSAPQQPQAPAVKKPADALQQQYFENIFHIASIEELTQEAEPEPVPFDPEKKEDRIIERFIKEEPHINPPSGDRLDTENKAKRSSEDNDELVTETLAKIYSDQMLYPKAIATYKKLMLKYPEKSSYFAARVEALERKTN